MKVSEGLRTGADNLLNSLFRGKNGHPPPGDQDTEEIYDFLRYGDKPSSRVGEVCENSLELSSPDSPERKPT